MNEKKTLFFCINIFTNKFVVSVFQIKIITTSNIIKKLNLAIKTRLSIKSKIKLIIHIYCMTQFSNATYDKFIQKNKSFIRVNMSRANVPKNNAVAERFIQTFKQHKI